MTTSIKEGANGETAADLHAIMSDIASLQRDLATLAGHFKNGAVNGVSDAARSAAGQIGEQASRAYDNWAVQGDRSVKAISKQIEEQPVMSLLIAFGLGFLGSRLLAH